jgi:hypothetical protein
LLGFTSVAAQPSRSSTLVGYRFGACITAEREVMHDMYRQAS